MFWGRMVWVLGVSVGIALELLREDLRFILIVQHVRG